MIIAPLCLPMTGRRDLDQLKIKTKKIDLLLPRSRCLLAAPGRWGLDIGVLDGWDTNPHLLRDRGWGQIQISAE